MIRETIGAGSSMTVTIRDNGLQRALERSPFTVAYNLRRAFGRIAADHKKAFEASQPSPGMKRLARRAFVRIHTPRRGQFKSVRAFIGGRGSADGVQSSIHSFSGAAETHETGLTFRRRAPGMPARLPRRFAGLAKTIAKEKGLGGFGVTGDLLERLAGQRKLVTFRTKSGKLTTFVDDTPERPRRAPARDRNGRFTPRGTRARRRRLTPVATYHPEITLQPSLGFFDVWNKQVASRNQHLDEARAEITRRLSSRRRRRG